MSGTDVIELESSDEEAQEPVPKKAKPRPNAMVHFPQKPGSANNCKESQSKIQAAPSFETHKRTGLSGMAIRQNILPNQVKINTPIRVKMSNNCFRRTGNFKNNQTAQAISILKIPGQHSFMYQKQKVIQNPNLSLNPVKIHSTLSSLPPSITVKRTKGPLMKQSLAKRKKLQIQQNVQTVELDDEDSATDPLPVGPLWYMKPEDETKQKLDQKEQNNEEPEVGKFIEITIEDSPVKPKNDKTLDSTVTIEDSPHKPTPSKTKCNSKIDEDASHTPHQKKSRKMLNYPKEMVEVEIELGIDDNSVSAEMEQTKIADNNIIEVEESPLKTPHQLLHSPEKAPKPLITTSQPDFNINKDIIQIEDDSETNEFHPVYQSFIDLCFQFENSDDMKKIVDKKIKAYYRQVPKSYTDSEEFIEMVSSKITLIKAGPDKMYLYIKDIVDELNLQRKIAKNVSADAEDKKKEEAQTFLYGEDSNFDAKRQRQIRKLEKTIKKLHRAIQKLEEQEVDFDDEDDSVYLLTERYKERMIKVHAKFCQLTNTKMPSEPRIHIDTTPGKPTGAAKRLEKWINRKVPIGAPLPFPDFHDVLRCVREANKEDNLGWNEADIMEEARSLFVRCGRKLQRRRQENEWRLAASRISVDIDPAQQSEELKRKLDENRKTAATKETEVFNKFADRQNQLNLHPEEIGDKEADESPVDSDEEVFEETISLNDKEKRKETLKRLIHEKSKKCSNNKENHDAQDIEEKKELQGKGEMTEDTQVQVHADNDHSKLPETNKFNSENVDLNESFDIESDIDELNLLQKLYSENEGASSSSESLSSTSPISISDTLESGGESDQRNDVISIENSSFSESETNDKTDIDKNEIVCCSSAENKESKTNFPNNDEQAENLKTTDQVEAPVVFQKESKESVEESSQITEDILLASEDEVSQDGLNENGDSVNLKDDDISIGDTIVERDILNEDEENSKETPMDRLNLVTESEDPKLTTENFEKHSSSLNMVNSADPVKNIITISIEEEHKIETKNNISNQDIELTHSFANKIKDIEKPIIHDDTRKITKEEETLDTDKTLHTQDSRCKDDSEDCTNNKVITNTNHKKSGEAELKQGAEGSTQQNILALSEQVSRPVNFDDSAKNGDSDIIHSKTTAPKSPTSDETHQTSSLVELSKKEKNVDSENTLDKNTHLIISLANSEFDNKACDINETKLSERESDINNTVINTDIK